MTETIGFVGVGRMGSRMAENLLAAGYDVVAYDVDDERVRAMSDEEAEEATSVSDVAERATVVMTSLPTSDIVTDVYFGDDGLIENVNDGTMLVEMSTIEVAVVERIAEEVGGVEVVDCPVIGPPPEAAAGTLTIVVGGSEAAYERLRPVLEPLCNSLHHVGEVGAAKRIKLANNVMTYGNFAIAAEMIALVEESGIDPEQFFEITSSGAAGATIVDMKMPKAFEEDFEPGFTVDGARSDLQYALAMKEKVDFSAPLAATIAERFTFTASAGHGEKDYTVLPEVFSKRRE